MSNFIFVGTSLDGYIADRNGGLDFLQSVPNPDNLDFGFNDFMASVDGVLMGRATFETVLSFGGKWHYTKPVFVLSSTMKSVPDALKDKVEIVSGSLAEVVVRLNERGFNHLYIDGGKLIQDFLQQDMIDEMIITQLPVLLGGGIPLFADLPEHMEFDLVGTEVMLNAMVMSHYRRK